MNNACAEDDVLIFPVSYNQQSMWLLDQMEPGNPVYNVSANFRLSGSLNVTVLEQSFNEIVRRHESLRTTFSVMEGLPMQVVVPSLRLTLLVKDLRKFDEARKKAEVRQLITESMKWRFDLNQGPLLRTLLLKLDEQEHILLITMHHIISDGWSLGVFNQELSVTYKAFLEGKSHALPDLEIQYADYAISQMNWLDDGSFKEYSSYWEQKLEGMPDQLSLPFDRQRPAVRTYKGACYTLLLSKDLINALEVLSCQEGATLFMTVLAAFKVLLYRYTDEEEIVVGTPVAGRNHVEVEDLIGFFVNDLVLRTQVLGHDSFRALLHRVKEVALEGYAHQEFPFVKLVEMLRPQRVMLHNPLFQVWLAFHNMPYSKLDLPQLTTVSLPQDDELTWIDLALEFRQKDGHLEGTFTYNTDVFELATIARMAGHFERILQGIVANPDQCLNRLPLLTDSENYQLLVEWNKTQTADGRNICIHTMFEEQVRRTPDAVAIELEGQCLTYRELNSRANALAYQLQELGVEPEVLVAIFLERSLEILIALLGVLKAGGAYVPIDPNYPQERVTFMLDDSQARVAITQKKLISQLPIHQLHFIFLDSDSELVPGAGEYDPTVTVKLNNLVYVIYTSGSTGRPKGVEITHQALTNFLLSMKKTPGLTDCDVVLALTTISFDIATVELFLPLIVGARIVLVSREEASNGAGLLQKLINFDATVMQATPTTWQMLLAAGWKGNSKLKVLCGGEALPRKLAEKLLERTTEVWNLYGPTETTVWSTVSRVRDSRSGNHRQDMVEPIGRPIANTQIYILDKQLQPVPIGIPGEIYISGVGLARGYLNLQELTAERFIWVSFSNRQNVRLYKSGDLARYLPDGSIEFLGRIDHQVKIHGFRVELGEIEALLVQHPAVSQAVVKLFEESYQKKYLVVYVVACKGQTPSAVQLRSFLKQKLPTYMTPSSFVFLRAFRLTPNGKINRNFLPKPERFRPELEQDFTATRTVLEDRIASIWAEVLSLDKVGIYDNFFDMGGNSLLALQMSLEMCDSLKNEVALQLKEVLQATFRYQNIAELAIWIAGEQEKAIKQLGSSVRSTY